MVNIFKDIKSAFIRSDLTYTISKLSFRRLRNLLFTYISRKTGVFVGSPDPVTLFVEVVQGCNFNCIGCKVGTLFEKSFMSFDNFKKVIYKLRNAILIYPNGSGEPFLHKYIYAMLRFATDSGLIVLPFSNFSVISPEKLVESRVRKIFASIDSVDKDKFQKLRPGGNLDIISRNIKRVQEEKRKRNTPFPEICINFTLMKENISEVEDTINFGLKHGIKNFYFQTLFRMDYEEHLKDNVPDKTDLEKIKALKKKYKGKAKIFTISYYDFERGDYFSGFCQFAYSTFFISVSGDVYPCYCVYPDKRKYGGLFGNIFRDSYHEIMKKRAKFLMDFRRSCPDWCKGCPLYFRNC